MRRYIRALFLCVVFALFSVLYVFSKLNSLGTSVGGGAGSESFLRSAFNRGDTGQGARQRAGITGPYDQHGNNWNVERRADSLDGEGERGDSMHLAVVACGQRQEETITMLKSAVILSRKDMNFHIFAEDQLHSGLKEALDSWPRPFRSQFNYTVYPITFPSDNDGEWKKLFKPCASQRLFLPILLEHVDSLLYVDTDVLFLQPVEEMWALLARFNATQLAAMAPEHEEPRIGWYNRFARHPFYGTTGINSGVMLMNMTRIREALFKNDMTTVGLGWEELLMPLLQKYKLNITWGDQDLINIIFHHNPERLFVFPCRWNYRPDHCLYGSNCGSAQQEGVSILHGNRGVFHDERQPAFHAVYEAIRKYSFDEDLTSSLLLPLKEQLNRTTHTYCGKVSHLFTEKLGQTVKAIQRGG